MAIASVTCTECGNDLWEDRGDDFLHCTNCRNKRPYIRRQKRDDHITKSQQNQIKRIKAYFDGSRYSRDGEPMRELTKFETILQEGTGFVYLSIHTGKSVYTQEGGFFVIGRKGGLRLLAVYDLTDKDERGRHYCKMLNAKKGW